MNLVEVVVEIGNHRHRQRSRDAALPRISVQPRISLSASPPCFLPRHQPLYGLGFHRRDSSVGRVNHERRLLERPAGIGEGGARSVRSLAHSPLRRPAPCLLFGCQAFERRGRRVIPEALQIRMAPRGIRNTGRVGGRGPGLGGFGSPGHGDEASCRSRSVNAHGPDD